MHLEVRLHGDSVGTIEVRGEFSRFFFGDEYIDSPDRSVLGLIFEQDITAEHTGQRGLPSWFQNLLPEGSLLHLVTGQLRQELGRTPTEVEILVRLGEDLPGAVTVHEAFGGPVARERHGLERVATNATTLGDSLDFSLAGVGLKFSVIRQDDKFVAPATGSDGNWLIKLPDPTYRLLPVNEYASMQLASRVGINAAETILVGPDDLNGVPERFWRGESHALVVRRFDRAAGKRIHMEDFAQVRGFTVDQRYSGNFETVGALVWRQSRDEDLHEFVRRLTLNLLIGNDDAHLKNWSLIYPDRRVAHLSPAYDIVSVEAYPGPGLDRGTGLRLANSRRYEDVRLAAIDRLARKIGYSRGDLTKTVLETVDAVENEWEQYVDDLNDADFARRVSKHRSLMSERLRDRRARYD